MLGVVKNNLKEWKWNHQNNCSVTQSKMFIRQESIVMGGTDAFDAFANLVFRKLFDVNEVTLCNLQMFFHKQNFMREHLQKVDSFIA